MIILLLLLLTISAHNLSAAASNSSCLTASDLPDENKATLTRLIEPITITKEKQKWTLSTAPTYKIGAIFSDFTPNIIDLNAQLSEAVLTHSAVLSSEYINTLLIRVTNETISKQDLRRELARCTLCIAERIQCETKIFVDGDLIIDNPKPISGIHFKEPIRPKKTYMMRHLLYAACFPEYSVTHSPVFDYLQDLNFEPKSRPIVIGDADAQNISRDTVIDGSSECAPGEPCELVAQNLYDLAIEELNFIKSHLSYLAPTNARASSDLAYLHTLLSHFHVKTAAFHEAPAQEMQSFYFDEQLTKVLLVLQRHAAHYANHHTAVVKYPELIRWRFNLFTDIEA